MNWLAIDQMLKAVLNAISGIPVGNTQAAEQSQYFPQIGLGEVTDGHGNILGEGDNDQAKLTYDVLSVLPIGREELRTRYDAAIQPVDDTYAGPGAPLGSIIYSTQGNREIHIQVLCECFDLTDGKGAVPILEKVRTALNLPSVHDAIVAAGIALQTCGTVTPHSYDDDNGRKVSSATLEVIFNGADGVEDLPVTTIQDIGMTTTVYGTQNGPDGPA